MRNVETDQILQIVEAKVVDSDGRRGQERQVSPVEWYQRYRQKMEPALSGTPEMKPLPASNFKLQKRNKQVATFFRRNLARKYADKQYMAINLIGATPVCLYPCLRLKVSLWQRIPLL